MAYKIFIDGQAGTTGLRLAERLSGRSDLELIEIEEKLRKDTGARLSCISEADVSFLCLPDEDAREVAFAVDAAADKGRPGSKQGNIRIIDCSSAHRTLEGWTYGMPELSGTDEINGHTVRVANPGCHATGFILSVRPLIDAGIVDPEADFVFYSLTGYSGGGKSMIEQYENAMQKSRVTPRRYALSQDHKHLPEMHRYSGLEKAPMFFPVVCDFYCGMLTCAPLPRSTLRRSASVKEVREILAGHYENRPAIKVRETGEENSDAAGGGFLTADAFAGRDDLEIFVTGKDDRIEIVSRYDNLGKGASGAAIQNMNLMLGLYEGTGLVLGA